ncbi:MAG: hypothetical protein COA97_02530 [Flavobacteriales bacterium]|nr:MAG: hypothetical protein COA97_02530 [Flavobacteriales bacterium]
MIGIHLELNNKKRKDGLHNVMLRLSYKRKLKRIKTTVFVKEKDFKKNNYAHWIGGTRTMRDKQNTLLLNLIGDAQRTPSLLEKKGIPPTIDNVAEYLKGNEKEGSFVSYAKKIKQRFLDSEQINSYKKYKTFITKLQTYLGEGKDLKFNQINVSFLVNYEVYLKKIGNSINTVQKEIKVLRAILYRAINEDLFEQEKNPFFRFKIKAAKTSKKKLSANEVKKIEKLKLEKGTTLWHVRNYWMLSFFLAGIRFNDCCQLKWKAINNGRFEYQMHKTGETKSIEIHPKAQKILSYYEDDDKNDDDYIFPILDPNYKFKDKLELFTKISSKNAMVNNNLKKIGKKAGIKTPLNFHLSRHSFAFIARKSGKMTLYQISKQLGHSDLKTSERYFSGFDELTENDEAMRDVFDY